MTTGNAKVVLKRNRAFVIAGLGGIAGISCVYIFHLAREMGAATGMEMGVPRMQGWKAVDFFLMFVMWAVMMVAMMTPSVAPMILTYSRVNRRNNDQRSPCLATGVFLAGYLVVWTGFSAVATLASGDSIAPPCSPP